MIEFLISAYGALWILVGVAYALLGVLLMRSFAGRPAPRPLGYNPPPVHAERPKPPPAAPEWNFGFGPPAPAILLKPFPMPECKVPREAS